MHPTLQSQQTPADLGAASNSQPDLAAQVAEVIEKYPSFRFVDAHLHGHLAFRTQWKEYPEISDSFEIGIEVPSDFPTTLPSVREIGTRTANYPHVNPSGTFCLGIPTKVRDTFAKEGTLLSFIEKVIVPYLYAFRIWQEFGVYPFGDLDHGGDGILQSYRDYFDTDDLGVIQFLGINVTGTYKGHHLCPCGSKKKIRKCHGAKLLALRDQKYSDKLYEFFFSCAAYSSKATLPRFFRSKKYLKALERFQKTFQL